MVTESESGSSSQGEFDRSNFPELIGCKIMPSGEENAVEVEVEDAEGNKDIALVPSQAVIRTNLPQIVQKLREDHAPREVTKALEDDIGMGLLACRISETLEDMDLVRIALPTLGESKTILIDKSRLAKRR